MNDHTPKPWVYRADDGEVRADDDRCCVATVEILDDSDANGRLIAAAPDLLAACEELVKWEERRDDRECRASIGQTIRAAIAKARGR